MDVWRAESRCASPPAAAIGRAAPNATVATPGDDVARALCFLQPSDLVGNLFGTCEGFALFDRRIAISYSNG